MERTANPTLLLLPITCLGDRQRVGIHLEDGPQLRTVPIERLDA